MPNLTYATLGTLKPSSDRESGSVQAAEPVLPATKPTSSAEPTELAHYHIVRLLGQGGMGKVYEAEDMKLQRTVALKVMLPDLTALLPCRERFLREARSMAAVRNDHVVTIYEVGQADEIPYLAMEFLQGQALETWLRANEVPGIGDIVRIGKQIATGLGAAQACGLIHRDIKPGNIWLEAPSGRVKILDFGLARPAQAASGLTEVGDVIGTPHYMSPEQARGETVDGRSDLFSLGVVLYQLCTRQLPFRGKTMTAVLTALATAQPTPIRDLNPDVPPALADLIMRLLAKDPAERPQTAACIIDDLRAIEGGLADTASALGERSAPMAPSKTPTLGPDAFTNTLADAPAAPASAPTTRRRRSKWLALVPLGFFASVIGAVSWGLGLWSGANLDSGSTKAEPATSRNAAVALASGTPVRLGVLYSRTGTMAISERAILDGALLAVGEINENGGVLGRPLELVIEDGQSDEEVFARKAAKLIDQDKVCALFGCWTSASRKAVQAVVESRGHVLCYPVSYEGMETSPHIVYGGSVPNQQILPALKWTHGFLNKRRWFLAGLDTLYSRAAHAVVRDEAKALGTKVIGEEFLLHDGANVAALVHHIEKTKPDLIINTIKGDANVALFRALRRAGITADAVPTLSFAVSEEELSSLPPSDVQGDYAAGNYFHSIESKRNEEFLRRVQKRFDSERIVSDPMQTTYDLVHLWSIAAKAAGHVEPANVLAAIKGQSYDAPQGRISIDPATLHTVQHSRVGVINEQGRFMEVYVSPRPVPPEPFPGSRERSAWESFLGDLHQRWGGKWHNPGAK